MDLPFKVYFSPFRSSFLFFNREVIVLPPSEIVIAVVACGMRLQETLNMIKTAIIFITDDIPLKFMIVAENNLMDGFREKLDDWQKLTKNRFTFEIFPLTFPAQNAKEWKQLFKPCAAQRLFLPVSSKVTRNISIDNIQCLFPNFSHS